MSDLIATLRAIVRHELERRRFPELGIVTEAFSREDDGSANNHQVNVRLQASGVEIQRASVAVGRPGLSALPAVGDLVVVAYLDGDVNAPVVLGALYDEQGHPPVAGPREVVYQPPHEEEGGVRWLHLAVPGGTTLTVDDEATVLSAGGTEVRVTHGGDVVIRSAANLQLTADGDISLTASGDLLLEAQGNVAIKGTAKAALEGGATTTVKGPQISLAGNTQFSPG